MSLEDPERMCVEYMFAEQSFEVKYLSNIFHVRSIPPNNMSHPSGTLHS